MAGLYGRANLILWVLEKKARMNKKVGSEGVVVMREVVLPGVASLYGRANLDLRVVVKRVHIRLMTWGG